MGDKPDIRPADIKKFREKKKLTQQQLAAILNVSVTTVSRWETGAKQPTGTSKAILAVLVSRKRRVPAIGSALGGGIAGFPLGSGFEIYRLLREKLEGQDQ